MRGRMLGILRQYTSHWNKAAMKKQWENANTGLQHQQKPHSMGFTIYQFNITCGISSARSDVWLCLENPDVKHPSICTFIKRHSTVLTYLQQLCLHGSCDGGWVDELEGWCSIIGILNREHHQHPDSVVAAVHRHRTAATHRIHLWAKAIALSLDPPGLLQLQWLKFTLREWFLCT